MPTPERARKFRTIVADPPWPYRLDGREQGLTASKEHRPNSAGSFLNSPGAARRYGSISMADLKALEIPSDDNAHLYLWTTNAFMVEAHDLARAWRFEPKTILTWGKVCADDPTKASMKMGYWFRGATEHILFCVRGSLRLKAQTFSTLYLWPRHGHSQKPDAFYDLVEQASPGPYLDIFARSQRLGWSTWGNECFEHVSLKAVA